MIIIYNKENYEPDFISASKLKVGDLIRTTEGISEVIEINKEIKYSCYKFVVDQGTVLANDILIGAFYIKGSDNRKNLKNIKDSAKFKISTIN